ncbi:MAG: ABC transporter ATP-binding protein [Clostridia bacterium]
MINLKDVTKYYSTGDVVALGLRKVNITLNVGEFVAVTGESGSGKSTFLNVISGIDSYEEGEMTAFGEETSGYTKQEWEEYRKKYNSFIFQDYNIIASYTVLENVELALLDCYTNHKERRKRALDLIGKVGLITHKNMKAAKLSGGQKQRMVIARALAHDSPIILADEPTGNLDANSGAEIMKLLSEVGVGKLVVVVTHNYEQVEKYATRKLRFFDGELIEDLEIKPYTSPKEVKPYSSVKKSRFKRFKNDMWISLRSLKNTPKKTIFTFSLMLITALMFFSIAASTASMGVSYPIYNFAINNLDKERLIVKKIDDSILSEQDLNQLSQMSGVTGITKYDYVSDTTFSANIAVKENEDAYVRTFNFYPKPLSAMKENALTFNGKLPQNENECFLVLPLYLKHKIVDLVGKSIEFIISYERNEFEYIIDESEKLNNDTKMYSKTDDFTNNSKINLTVSGYVITNDIMESYIYLSPIQYKMVIADCYKQIRGIKIKNMMNTNMNQGDELNNIVILLSNEMGDNYAKLEISQHFADMSNIKQEDLFKVNIEFDLSNSLFQAGFTAKDVMPTIVSSFPWNTNNEKAMIVCTINKTQVEKVLEDKLYQVSLYTSQSNMQSLQDALFLKGYFTNRAYMESNIGQFAKIVNFITALSIFMSGIVVYFIMYIVTKQIVISQNTDYTIMRSVGVSKKQIRFVIMVESLFSAISALIVSILSIICALITKAPEALIFSKITPISYIIIITAILIIAVVVSVKCSSKLFIGSVKKNLSENKE